MPYVISDGSAKEISQMAINAMETVFHYLLIITFIIAALAFLLSIIARRFTLLSLLVIPTVLYLMNVIDVMFATTLVFILACVCEWILRVTKGESGRCDKWTSEVVKMRERERMNVFYCDVCKSEVWARHKGIVSCRCGRVVRVAAEGELITKRGREYLQLLLPLQA